LTKADIHRYLLIYIHLKINFTQIIVWPRIDTKEFIHAQFS